MRLPAQGTRRLELRLVVPELFLGRDTKVICNRCKLRNADFERGFVAMTEQRAEAVPLGAGARADEVIE